MKLNKNKHGLILVTCCLIIILIGIIPISGWIRQQSDIYDVQPSRPSLGTGTRPVAVMVENSFAARPQSGLNLADEVFEVVDEYGITRFVAIYNSNDAPVVGPVRSSRPYYAEIARGFDPIYAFFGTYPECYKVIEDMGMYVLSAMSDSSGNSSITGQAPYWRDWNRSSIQDHIDFSTHAYAPRGFNIDYTYNKDGNYYLRYMGGRAHKDYNTGGQITVKNVVVMVTDIMGPLDNYGILVCRTTASGTAFIFQDGKAISGTWQRGSVYELFIFRDSAGNSVSFNGGSTWIAVVQGTEKVSFQ